MQDTIIHRVFGVHAAELAGIGLDGFAPYPDDVVLSGRSQHQRYQFHHNEIFVGTYQAKPAKLSLKDYPQDEFMLKFPSFLGLPDLRPLKPPCARAF